MSPPSQRRASQSYRANRIKPNSSELRASVLSITLRPPWQIEAALIDDINEDTKMHRQNTLREALDITKDQAQWK